MACSRICPAATACPTALNAIRITISWLLFASRWLPPLTVQSPPLFYHRTRLCSTCVRVSAKPPGFSVCGAAPEEERKIRALPPERNLCYNCILAGEQDHTVLSVKTGKSMTGDPAAPKNIPTDTKSPHPMAGILCRKQSLSIS